MLLLTVVAILFTRFFPLFVRFFSGDSPTLVHLLAGASLALLGLTTATQELRVDASMEWVWKVALVGVVAVLYYETNRAERNWQRFSGLVAQGGLIALLIYADTPTREDFLFIPTVAAALLVPLQVLFITLRRLNREYPAWASMAIWHMARNPLQYSWLVLLLVMVTSLGILATTVGGTLNRSYEERILYEVGSDLRVTGTRSAIAVFNETLMNMYLEIPGVDSISRALRGDGRVGPAYLGNNFSILAIETEKFPNIAWYRDDFSRQPLTSVMRALQSGVSAKVIDIPEGAQKLKVWANVEEYYPNMFMRMIVQDNQGVLDTLLLGRMQEPGWSLLEADIPQILEWPLSLVSVQIYQPDLGSVGMPGTIFLDDIHVEFNDGQEPQTLDDFERGNGWVPLAASRTFSNTAGVTNQTKRNGQQAGVFSFSKDTDQGIREFYRSPSGGPIPVVTSASFTRATGVRVGDAVVVNMLGRPIPVRVMDTVDYFPTMDPAGNGFLLVDLDNVLRYLNTLSSNDPVWPNELFISEFPGAEEKVRRSAIRLAPSREMIHDRATLVESIRLDPLITAGWKAMVLLAVGIILISATLGYMTYFISFADQNRSEMGVLQVLGLSKRQMGWLLRAEHLLIAALGLLIGTAAGFAMSNMMVSALAVTGDGDPILPPLVLTTNWAIMGPIYFALVVIFLGSLFWLNRTSSNVDLYGTSRVESV